MSYFRVNRLIFVLLCYLACSPFSIADDILFEDDLSFDSADQDLDSFSDSDDIFEFDDSASKSLSGLGLKFSQKWDADPGDNWETTKHLSELVIDLKGMLPSYGYGELQLNLQRYWPNDSNYSTDTSDTEIERAFVQFSSDKWSSKLGKYTIGWGEIEGGALDVINPGGSLSDPLPDSQWFMNTTRYWDSSDLSIFYNHNPGVIKIKDVSLVDDSGSEIGLRLGINNDGNDTAIYFARLIPNNALKDIVNGNSKAKPYHLLGLSTNQAIDGYLIKYDLAYKRNLQHNRADKLVDTDRIDLGVALDIQQDDRQWIFSLSSQYLIDYYSDFLTPGLVQNVSTPRHSLSYSASLSDTFDDKDYKWNVATSSSSNGDMKLLSAGIGWDINDQWSAALRGTRISASSDRAFHLLDGYKRVGIELNYQY